MWTWLASFISGPFINAALSAYKLRLSSINTQDAQALALLEAEIAAESAARVQATNLLIAEQGNWLTRSIRPLFAMPFIIYLWYIIVFNKVLGIGVVEHGIDENMWSVFQTIIISYFGATAVERVSKIFKR